MIPGEKSPEFRGGSNSFLTSRVSIDGIERSPPTPLTPNAAEIYTFK